MALKFDEWLAQRTSVDPKVLGGSRTFKGTRLSVTHVGDLWSRGATLEQIKSDYPYLSDTDIFNSTFTLLRQSTPKTTKISTAWTPEERLTIVSALVNMIHDDIYLKQYGQIGRPNITAVQFVIHQPAEFLEDFRDSLEELLAQPRHVFPEDTIA